MSNPLAERYARAIYAVAVDRNQSDAVKQDVLALSGAFAESEELSGLLSRAERFSELAESICEYFDKQTKPTPLMSKLLKILANRKRIGLLPDIVAAYLVEVKKHDGIIQAQVTSIRNLDPKETDAIQMRLNNLLGQPVDIEWRQDPSVLGGLYVQVGDSIMDGTLATQMSQLKKHLIQS